MPHTMKQPVTTVARDDFAILREESTVHQALDEIRSSGLGERIIYFYVVNKEDLPVGVLPTRRLLTAPLDKPISELMIRRLVTIPQTATVLEAHEQLYHHKLLALPVVDEAGHIVGVIDVNMFTDEDVDVEPANRMQTDEVFETIGFRLSQVRDASPFKAFRFRFPWLIATIASGTICALMAGSFEVTLAKSLVLAFFLTLVLGLGESVSIQSMTVTIQSLRSMPPTLSWYGKTFWREIRTAILLGGACGFVVGFTVWIWKGNEMAAIAIGGSILLIISAACLFGLTIPSLLHALKLDPRVAAGPATLAITDICTVLLYLSIATLLL